jgi:hypothetical protein
MRLPDLNEFPKYVLEIVMSIFNEKFCCLVLFGELLKGEGIIYDNKQFAVIINNQ